jgi:hypothetical protein
MSTPHVGTCTEPPEHRPPARELVLQRLLSTAWRRAVSRQNWRNAAVGHPRGAGCAVELRPLRLPATARAGSRTSRTGSRRQIVTGGRRAAAGGGGRERTSQPRHAPHLSETLPDTVTSRPGRGGVPGPPSPVRRNPNTPRHAPRGLGSWGHWAHLSTS